MVQDQDGSRGLATSWRDVDHVGAWPSPRARDPGRLTLFVYAYVASVIRSVLTANVTSVVRSPRSRPAGSVTAELPRPFLWIFGFTIVLAAPVRDGGARREAGHRFVLARFSRRRRRVDGRHDDRARLLRSALPPLFAYTNCWHGMPARCWRSWSSPSSRPCRRHAGGAALAASRGSLLRCRRDVGLPGFCALAFQELARVATTWLVRRPRARRLRRCVRASICCRVLGRVRGGRGRGGSARHRARPVSTPWRAVRAAHAGAGAAIWLTTARRQHSAAREPTGPLPLLSRRGERLPAHRHPGIQRSGTCRVGRSRRLRRAADCGRPRGRRRLTGQHRRRGRRSRSGGPVAA